MLRQEAGQILADAAGGGAPRSGDILYFFDSEWIQTPLSGLAALVDHEHDGYAAKSEINRLEGLISEISSVAEGRVPWSRIEEEPTTLSGFKLDSEVNGLIETHSERTTGIHGINDTSLIPLMETAGGSEGDVLYHDGTVWKRLGIGGEDQVLISSGGLPQWSNILGLNNPIGEIFTSGLTAGNVDASNATVSGSLTASTVNIGNGGINFNEMSIAGIAPLHNIPVANAILCSNLIAEGLGASGQDAAFFRNANNLNAGTVPLGRLSGITNTEIDPAAAIAWSKVDKSGSSLADLTTRSADALNAGTLNDARLSANVVMVTGTQTISGIKTYSVGVLIERTAATNVALRSSITGSIYGEILADMAYTVGPGGPRDTRLRRTAAGVFTLDNNAGGNGGLDITGGFQVLPGSDWGGTRAALATSATSGFARVPVMAGAPSGIPSAAGFGGCIPLVADSTNNRLYLYYGGSWHYATLT